MWGVSLGGYYAARAAAFDQRIKACISLGGPFDWAAAWDGLPELTREAFRVRSHCKTEVEARKNAAKLTLVGVAKTLLARSSSSTDGSTASCRRPIANAWRAK